MKNPVPAPAEPVDGDLDGERFKAEIIRLFQPALEYCRANKISNFSLPLSEQFDLIMHESPLPAEIECVLTQNGCIYVEVKR